MRDKRPLQESVPFYMKNSTPKRWCASNSKDRVMVLVVLPLPRGVNPYLLALPTKRKSTNYSSSSEVSVIYAKNSSPESPPKIMSESRARFPGPSLFSGLVTLPELLPKIIRNSYLKLFLL
jgi:hypothetical protein